MTPCYSLDWLAFSALLPHKWEGAELIADCNNHGWGYVEHPPTRIYENVLSVYKTRSMDTKLFTICINPRTPILPPYIMHIQLGNAMCYADYIHVATAICRHYKATDIRVSRVDVACDIVQVNRYKSPESFVQHFVAQDVLLKRFAKWHIYGCGSQDGNTITGFAWGSRTSSVYCRFYNKLREMQDTKSSKPYIYERWVRHGWDGKTSVWRMEFECKRLRAMQGEEYINGSLYQWQPSDVELRFHGLLQQYAQFVLPTATRKTRCKPYNPITPNLLYPIVMPCVGDNPDTSRLIHKDADRLMTAMEKFTTSHVWADEEVITKIRDLTAAMEKRYWTAPQ